MFINVGLFFDKKLRQISSGLRPLNLHVSVSLFVCVDDISLIAPSITGYNVYLFVLTTFSQTSRGHYNWLQCPLDVCGIELGKLEMRVGHSALTDFQVYRFGHKIKC